MGPLTLTVSFRRLSGSSFLAQVISSLEPLLSIGCLVCLKYGAGLRLFPWSQVCSHNQSARNPILYACVRVCARAHAQSSLLWGGMHSARLQRCPFVPLHLKCAFFISRVFSGLFLRQACPATVTCTLENDHLWSCQPWANWRKMKMPFLLMCVQGFSSDQCSSHDLFRQRAIASVSFH